MGFKILLVVALVAFIGSIDALNCTDKATGKTKKCADAKKSCVIEATITTLDPVATVVTKQACDGKNLEKNPKEFVIPKEVKDGGKVTFYCNADNCNAEKEIKGIIVKGDGPKTIAAMTAANKAPTAEGDVAGAAQSTVAIATIAFSVVMARLAL